MTKPGCPSRSGVWSISADPEYFYVSDPIDRYGIISGDAPEQCGLHAF
jgi:hypothetical protein